MKSYLSIRKLVAAAIGAALFIALSFVAIPTGIPNTSLQPRMAVLGFFAAVFGPAAGAIAGFLGHALADALQGWGVWWSWVIPEAVIGVMIGAFFRRYKIEEGEFGKRELIFFNVMQVLANAVAWFLAAPLLDIAIYQEPANKVWSQGAVAGLSNMVVMAVLSSLLCWAYSKSKAKAGSLKAEN